ncbi:MAG: hypothetical protein Q4F18_14990, partial [Clostridia bacterium]|nr:hypothetical protein [Clostridia bacterium]
AVRYRSGRFFMGGLLFLESAFIITKTDGKFNSQGTIRKNGRHAQAGHAAMGQPMGPHEIW